MLLNIAKQLAKTRGFIGKNTAIFRKLPVIIPMGDFY